MGTKYCNDCSQIRDVEQGTGYECDIWSEELFWEGRVYNGYCSNRKFHRISRCLNAEQKAK